MKPTLFSRASFISVAFVAVALSSTGASAAVKATVLHSFSGPPDGLMPTTNLIADPAGNLYGTTPEGGANSNGYCEQNCGVAFELSPTANGVQETVLYNFCSLAGCADGADGGFPFAGITLDSSSGDLFGTTMQGGNSNCPPGCGVVFELTPGSSGWTEHVLYAFSDDASGEYPYGGLIIGPQGRLYGTTYFGGTNGKDGVVFELIPTRAGSWEEKALSFGSKFGSQPIASLTLGALGQVYGTTSVGGAGHGGVVFEITK